MRTSEPIDRRTVAVAVTADGRRVQLPGADPEVFPLSLLRSILVGIESLVLIVTGSRRENGGTRRSGRE
ncbi:MAG TPA: hypothetical protein VK831_01920 [Candidatus Deferrimicrobiaceae bacterium]|nr:hypothetical protein [Candidatus Deferrimicrobiaceae bacterium]